MTKVNTDAATVRLPPPLVFVGAMLLGGLVHRFVLPLRLPLAESWRIGLTAALAVPGIVILGLAVGLFRRTGQDPKPWKTTPEIISSGIYGWTRNPMYVGMALFQAAVGTGLANGWILALVPVALFTVYRTAVRHEEAYLERKFGRPYLDYKRSVRRWL